HSLLPRTVYGDLSVLDALAVCEQEFLQEVNETEQEREQPTEPEGPTELNVNDVLAEITRMLEEHTE
ncbi:MAG: hypothetical protein M3Y76_00990, partial [Chloroflexota bacterium]|nr:hypothetical protein [Chloroflexota bacterium]